eukprot:4895727-Pyramimonas_sp.AAC.1
MSIHFQQTNAVGGGVINSTAGRGSYGRWKRLLLHILARAGTSSGRGRTWMPANAMRSFAAPLPTP